jgi:hypothetical protein
MLCASLTSHTLLTRALLHDRRNVPVYSGHVSLNVAARTRRNKYITLETAAAAALPVTGCAWWRQEVHPPVLMPSTRIRSLNPEADKKITQNICITLKIR